MTSGFSEVPSKEKKGPVRPMPTWTSSATMTTSYFVHKARTAARYSSAKTRPPPSPWTASIISVPGRAPPTGRTRADSSCSSAVASVSGTTGNSLTARSRPSVSGRLIPPDTWAARAVIPWNPPSYATTPTLPVTRCPSLRAASTAVAPVGPTNCTRYDMCLVAELESTTDDCTLQRWRGDLHVDRKV